MYSILFSIIVPIYNVEKYLNECIESVLNQTYKNFELILVDDGSTDSCPEICDDYATKDNRIKVLHKKNGGLVSARKSGANISKGEYIVTVDGDDWITNDHLMKIYKQIKQYLPDVIWFGLITKYKVKEVLSIPRLNEGLYNKQQIAKLIYPQLIESTSGKYFSPNIVTKAYKREIYVKYQNLVDDRIKIGEDGACVKPIIVQIKSMAVIHDCLYYYRQNINSMTKIKKAFCFDDPLLISKHFEKNIDMLLLDFQQQIYRNTIHNLFNVCVSQFNRKEKYKIIRTNILKNLNNSYYINAINQCQYSKKYLKGQLALFSLKYRWCLLMKFYWLYKTITQKYMGIK